MNFNINLEIKKIRYVYNTIVFIFAATPTFIFLCDSFCEYVSLILAPCVTFSIVYLLELFIIKLIKINRNKWVLTCVVYSTIYLFCYISEHFFWQTLTICGVIILLALTFIASCFCVKRILNLLR